MLLPSGTRVPLTGTTLETSKVIGHVKFQLEVAGWCRGSSAALQGCVNDAKCMAYLLKTRFGFKDEVRLTAAQLLCWPCVLYAKFVNHMPSYFVELLVALSQPLDPAFFCPPCPAGGWPA